MPLDAMPQHDEIGKISQPLTAFTEKVRQAYDLDFEVIFRRLTNAFPCCQHVLSVEDLRPTRVTEMKTLKITTQNQDGTIQAFICKIPVIPEMWTNMENSIAMRKKLTSPMLPKLYRVISVRGLYRNRPECSMPIIMEEFVPHEATMEKETGHLAGNAAQYVDSFIINSLQLFHQMGAAGYAMIDNTAKNIAVTENPEKLNEAQFVYFDLGSIEPLIKRPHPSSMPTNTSKTTLERFLVILEKMKKNLPTPDKTELMDQLEEFTIYLNSYLRRASQKRSITKEQIVSDLEDIMRTYADIRIMTPGEHLRVSPPSARDAKVPEGMPDIVRRAIRKLLRV